MMNLGTEHKDIQFCANSTLSVNIEQLDGEKQPCLECLQTNIKAWVIKHMICVSKITN